MCTDMIKEKLPTFRVRNDLTENVFRVPVNEYAAKIEY